jgi:hypothetical protein
MVEEPVIIQMNISHYRAMLKLEMDREQRSALERLLTKAEDDLRLAANLNKQ